MAVGRKLFPTILVEFYPCVASLLFSCWYFCRFNSLGRRLASIASMRQALPLSISVITITSTSPMLATVTKQMPTRPVAPTVTAVSATQDVLR